MFSVRNGIIVAALKSGITLMRARPEALPRFSTATRTRAARRFLSCRLPRRPACSPPTHVSSTSTSPRNGSRVAFTIAPAKFVKHHPGSLVTGKAELTLKQQCGHSTLVRRHQIRRPEPVGQRGLRPVKNGPGGQRDLVTALDALLASLLHQLIGSPMPASRTDEAIRPPTSRQVLLAGFFRGEVRLKLTERLGERRSRHHSTLPVGVC